MAGRIRRRRLVRLSEFGRQCVSVVLAMAVLAHPAWAAGPVAPQLSSRPGAAYTLFLNFSGFTWNQDWDSSAGSQIPGTVPAYNVSGNDTTFTTTELANIKDIWSRVSEKYAGFNVNVTTVDPATVGLADDQRQAFYNGQARMMHTVIGGNNTWLGGGGGVSYVGVTDTSWEATSNYHLNWVFPANLGSSNKNIAEATAHENGHGLGLDHQSDWYSGNSTLATEYSDGSGAASAPAPIMGNSYSASRGLWGNGTINTGANQNDVNTMLANPSLTVMDDGVGHDVGTATPLPGLNGTVDHTLAKGVITTVAGNATNNPTAFSNYTQDLWSFTTTGGNVTLTARSGRSTITSGTADPGSTLDASVSILASDGTTVVVAPTAYVAGQYDMTITGNLTAGNYYVKVTTTNGTDGAGTGLTDSTYVTRTFFDMGSYFLTGTIPGYNAATAYYWDTASGNGFGTASGTWSATTNSTWSSDSTGNAARIASVSVATGDVVHFGSETNALAAGTVTVSGTVSANRITFGKASGSITLSGGTITLSNTAPEISVRNTTDTISATLAGTAGLLKSGDGTLLLTGANAYTGSTTIGAGTLAVSGSGSLPSGTAVNMSAVGGVFDISGISGSTTTVGSITGRNGAAIVLGSKTLAAGGDNSSTTFAGGIIGTGGFTKAGSGTLTLTGSNFYQGATTVSGGTLALTGDGRLPSTSLVDTATSGARFDISAVTPTSLRMGSIAGVSGSSIVLGGKNLTAVNNATTTFAGVISGSAGSLTLNGTGILTLSGTNTYTGATSVAAGTLVAGANAPSGSSGAFGSATSEVSLGTAGGNSDAGILTGGAVTVARTIRIPTSNTTDTGARVLTIGGNTADASTFSGSIFLGSSSSAGRGVTLTAASGGNVTFSGVIQNPTGMDATTYTVTKAGLGTVILTNTNTYTGATLISAGSLQIGNGGTSGNLSTSSAITNDATLVFNRSNTVTQGTNFNSVIGGAGQVMQSGSGTLTLNGANTYSGGTVVNAGSLVVANGATSALGATAGSLTVNGGLLNMGNNTLTVGNLTGAGGTIQGGASGTRTLTIGNGNTGGGNFQGVIANGTGTQALTKTGTGTITLSGNNTYTGATNVNAGTLLVHGSLAAGSAVTVSSTGALGGTGTISGSLAATGNATIAPGASPGSLELGSTFSLGATSTLAIELGGTSFTLNGLEQYDRLKVAGTSTLSGLLDVSLYGGWALGANQYYGILDAVGGRSGFFSNYAEGATLFTDSGYALQITYSGAISDSGTPLTFGGSDVVLYTTAVPEPGSLALLGAAVAGVGFLRHRRRAGRSTHNAFSA